MTGFEQIYLRYFRDVFLFARGLTGDDHLAEDITSDTFFKALQAIDGFRGDCDIRVWLCQIARNSYFSLLKKRKREIPLPEPDIPADSAAMEERLMDRDSALRLRDILDGLGEPYRQVFSLRVFGELPYARIGNLWGKSANWACVTFHRAREKIRQRMEEYP